VSVERERLAERADASGLSEWHDWGPYVAERQWGTVREDYSPDGEAWDWFPHDHARSRTYRWGEDGLAAISDRRQGLCVGLALWNGVDPYLKERPFGLANAEGNHGEDAKDYWWHLDAVPSSAWLSARYHYPQAAFPYAELVQGNAARGLDDPEYELVDTGVFDDDRYWVVDVDYAKGAPDDICMRIRVRNAGPEAATLHVLPHLWFRNTWSWAEDPAAHKPSLGWDDAVGAVRVAHPGRLGEWLVSAAAKPTPVERAAGPPVHPEDAEPTVLALSEDEFGVDGEAAPEDGHRALRWLFCENETNQPRIWGDDCEPTTPYPKDGINDHVVDGAATVNPERTGTKAAAWWTVTVEAGATHELRLRLTCIGPPASAPDRPPTPEVNDGFDRPEVHDIPVVLSRDGCRYPTTPRPAVKPYLGADFDAVMARRRAEADEFYAELTPVETTDEEARIMRQAFAGLLWSRQFYRYDVARWLDGDPAQPPPPPGRGDVRNGAWRHLDANDIISMPDTWEYPWFASWDLAFHCVALAHVDPAFAKHQLLLLTREWYQHPNGQLPAYEWDFGDANPPVHAWAAMRVFETDGSRDLLFLERIFHKLVINFTWWVNREDNEGDNVFEGGFLGLDNIGPFNRSAPLPGGGTLEQSDGTAWMAMYCLNLLEIAITLAAHDEAYEDMAVKFLEHFTLIAAALTDAGLWDDEDGFFYDTIRRPDGVVERVKVRSMVGLIPLVALTVIEDPEVRGLPEFRHRAAWYISHRRNLTNVLGRFLSHSEPGAPATSAHPDPANQPDIDAIAEAFDGGTDGEAHTEAIAGEVRPGAADPEPAGTAATAAPAAPARGVGAVVKGSAGLPGEVTAPATMLAVVEPDRLARVLRVALDEGEFLSPHGLRSLSRWHAEHPADFDLDGERSTVSYSPAESTSRLFGGNSNWRGPVWFPLNFLLLESLLRAHRFLGAGFTVELPVGSGRQATLAEVADDLAERLIGLFRQRPAPDDDGVLRRPVTGAGGLARFEHDPAWNELPAFYEYFHGDTGTGLGASHQTGWTALVADLLVSRPVRRRLTTSPDV
jgi:hypothetical protein